MPHALANLARWQGYPHRPHHSKDDAIPNNAPLENEVKLGGQEITDQETAGKQDKKPVTPNSRTHLAISRNALSSNCSLYLIWDQAKLA